MVVSPCNLQIGHQKLVCFPVIGHFTICLHVRTKNTYYKLGNHLDLAETQTRKGLALVKIFEQRCFCSYGQCGITAVTLKWKQITRPRNC